MSMISKISPMARKKEKAVSTVCQRRVLDSKDIDFIIQYYVNNLNKQRKGYITKSRKRRISIISFVVLSLFITLTVYRFSTNKSANNKKEDLVPYDTPLYVDNSQTNEDKEIKTEAVLDKTASTADDESYLKEDVSSMETTPSPIVSVPIDESAVSQEATSSPQEEEEEEEENENIPSKESVIPQKIVSLPPQDNHNQTTVEENDKKTSNIIIKEIITCENVKDLKPIGKKDNFSTKRVFCWLNLEAEKIPYKIYFTFFHKGKKVYHYPKKISRKKAVTWCYKATQDTGEWKVEISDENNNVLGSKPFFVTN